MGFKRRQKKIRRKGWTFSLYEADMQDTGNGLIYDRRSVAVFDTEQLEADDWGIVNR